MAKVAPGDTVKVHYTGKLEDDTVFDSSVNKEPIEFTLGQRQLIPGFEQAVIGMEPGDQKSVNIPMDEAYGPHRDDMILEVKNEEFPEHITPEVGLQLQLSQPNGQTIDVIITNMENEMVTLDANHPLAGKNLIFDIELVEIV